MAPRQRYGVYQDSPLSDLKTGIGGLSDEGEGTIGQALARYVQCNRFSLCFDEKPLAQSWGVEVGAIRGWNG